MKTATPSTRSSNFVISTVLSNGAYHITWMFRLMSSPSSAGARKGLKLGIGLSFVVYWPSAVLLPLVPMLLIAWTFSVQLRPDGRSPT